MAQPLEKEETTTLESLADAALEKCDGNWEQAADTLLDWLRKDKALLWQIVEKYLPNIAWSAIRAASRRIRSTYFTATAEEPDDKHEEARARVVRTARASIFDYPLSGGLHLGDATRDRLLDEAMMHEKQEIGNRRQKDWYRAIAAKMPKRKKDVVVRECLSEDVVEELLD